MHRELKSKRFCINLDNDIISKIDEIATQKKLKRSIILNKILEKIAIESKKRDLLK